MQVALKLLLCWQGVVVNSQDVVKPYIHGLLPPVVSVLPLSNQWQAHSCQRHCTASPRVCCPQIERLGDNKQDVRQAACDLLLDLLQVGGW